VKAFLDIGGKVYAHIIGAFLRVYLISFRLRTEVQHKVDEIIQTVAANSAKIHHINLVVAFTVTLKGKL
jgi:hypothetical protein